MLRRSQSNTSKKEKPTANGKVRREKSKSARTSEVPEVTSPISIEHQSPYRSESVNEMIEEVTSPLGHFGQQEPVTIKREHVDHTRRMTGQQDDAELDDGSYDDEGYLVDHVEEFDAVSSQLYNDSDMLVTPLVFKEMQKQEQLRQLQQQQQQQQQKTVLKGESLLKMKKNGSAANKTQKSLLTANKPAETNGGKTNEAGAGPSGMGGNFANVPTTSASTMGYGVNDFIVNDQVPSDLFDDNDSQLEKESPMLGVGFNFDGGFYNPNVNINEMKGRQQLLQQQHQQQQQQPGPSHEIDLQIGAEEGDEDAADAGSSKAGRSLARFVSNDSDLNKLNSILEYGHHIDNVQTDLDSLKDLLKGEGYQFDANTLLGLFAGNEDLLGYDFPMNLPDSAGAAAGGAVDDGVQKKNVAAGGAITAGVASADGGNGSAAGGMSELSTLQNCG